MKTIKLINGQFTPEETKEVLLDMIAKKINFHNLKNLKSQVHFSQPDAEAEQRIKELREAKAQVLAMVQEAKEEQKGLVIAATVYVALEASEQVLELCSGVESY